MTASSRRDRAVGGLAIREVGRGVAVLLGVTVLMITTTVRAFDATGLATSGGLSSLVENPAVRALYGTAFDVTNAGGFAVWRVGNFLAVFAALWASLATVRVLRGEEEAGRWDLMLAAPLSRERALAGHVVVLALGGAAVGLAVFVAFVAGGQPPASAALYAFAMALLTMTFVGVGAVAAQLLDSRRRAAGVAGAVVAVSYLVRMGADGVDGSGWLRWLSPFGWVENVEAFAGDQAAAIIPLALSPVILVALALVLGRRRDLGAGVIAGVDAAPARTFLLRSPARFALRQRLGGVLVWGFGLAVVGVVLGAITKAFVDFFANDPDIVEMAERFGYTSLASPVGFIASMDALIAVVISVYAVEGVSRLWEDEQADRLDLVFAARVSRTSWLSAAVVVTMLLAGLLLAVVSVSTWVGAKVSGVDVSLLASVRAVANLVPLVGLFLGVAVLLHGVRPAWTLPLGAGGAAGAYLVNVLGPALDLPGWVISISPWHHVALFPTTAIDWSGVALLAGVGVACGCVGFVAFARRDLR